VSNALNFSPDHAEIQISVTEKEETVTVTIRDEGPGIPGPVQKRIFDKFYTIGKRHGTGLGLSICRGIIEAHKGEIHVLDRVAKGSALYFTLPKNIRGTVNEQQNTRN
jgi:two-component system sensor histidine kinase KdpD